MTYLFSCIKIWIKRQFIVLDIAQLHSESIWEFKITQPFHLCLKHTSHNAFYTDRFKSNKFFYLTVNNNLYMFSKWGMATQNKKAKNIQRIYLYNVKI